MALSLIVDMPDLARFHCRKSKATICKHILFLPCWRSKAWRERLCSEADRLGVSKDGTRFEILIRVAAKQRPDLIAADKSEQQGAEPRVDGPGKEAVQEAVPVG